MGASSGRSSEDEPRLGSQGLSFHLQMHADLAPPSGGSSEGGLCRAEDPGDGGAGTRQSSR